MSHQIHSIQHTHTRIFHLLFFSSMALNAPFRAVEQRSIPNVELKLLHATRTSCPLIVLALRVSATSIAHSISLDRKRLLAAFINSKLFGVICALAGIRERSTDLDIGKPVALYRRFFFFFLSVVVLPFWFLGISTSDGPASRDGMVWIWFG